MRIFLAGATGVIGIRLLPLMLAEGHVVAAMTRTQGKIDGLRAAGVTPVLCDVFDQRSLVAAVKDFKPDLVVHQMTDLPDDVERLIEFLPRNNRVRGEGTRNLLAAAKAAGAPGFVAQSIAWRTGLGTGPILDAHENGVIAAGGTVLRYGLFYGPGTYFESDPPPPPRIHIDEVARRTMRFLTGSRGIFTITDEHDVAADAEKLRKLHVPGDPLILANVWDPTSARVVEAAGMRAIATSSNALAPLNGHQDHGHLPADVAFSALRSIADTVRLPVTADLEDGYGVPAEEFADRLARAGACGANLEDSDHRAGRLGDAERLAQYIASVKAAARARGFDPVINARVDVHVHKGPLEEGLRRARLYLDAGADCVFPIFLSDASAIRKYVALGPTNILYAPGTIALRELAGLGVARISVASFFFRLLIKRLQVATDALRRFDDKGFGSEWKGDLLDLKL